MRCEISVTGNVKDIRRGEIWEKLFYRNCVVLLCNTQKCHIAYSESEYNKKRHTGKITRCVSFVFVMFVNSWMRIVEPKSVIRKGSFLIFLMTAIRKMDFHLSDS